MANMVSVSSVAHLIWKQIGPFCNFELRGTGKRCGWNDVTSFFEVNPMTVYQVEETWVLWMFWGAIKHLRDSWTLSAWDQQICDFIPGVWRSAKAEAEADGCGPSRGVFWMRMILSVSLYHTTIRYLVHIHPHLPLHAHWVRIVFWPSWDTVLSNKS